MTENFPSHFPSSSVHVVKVYDGFSSSDEVQYTDWKNWYRKLIPSGISTQLFYHFTPKKVLMCTLIERVRVTEALMQSLHNQV